MDKEVPPPKPQINSQMVDIWTHLGVQILTQALVALILCDLVNSPKLIKKVIAIVC